MRWWFINDYCNSNCFSLCCCVISGFQNTFDVLSTLFYSWFQDKGPEGQWLLSACESLMAVWCWIYCLEYFLHFNVSACVYSSQNYVLFFLQFGQYLEWRAYNQSINVFSTNLLGSVCVVVWFFFWNLKRNNKSQ